jgi:hypothetical protein
VLFDSLPQFSLQEVCLFDSGVDVMFKNGMLVLCIMSHRTNSPFLGRQGLEGTDLTFHHLVQLAKQLVSI